MQWRREQEERCEVSIPYASDRYTLNDHDLINLLRCICAQSGRRAGKAFKLR